MAGDPKFPKGNAYLVFYRIADRAKFVRGHFSGVGNLPIFSLSCSESRALVAAPHRSDEIKFDIRQL